MKRQDNVTTRTILKQVPTEMKYDIKLLALPDIQWEGMGRKCKTVLYKCAYPNRRRKRQTKVLCKCL